MLPGSLSSCAVRNTPQQLIQESAFVFFLLFNYFQMVECVKIYRINDRERKRFERLTEANRPLVGMIASIRARQQPCSASTWCTLPTAWAQQATAPTASPGEKTKKQHTSSTEERNKMGCNNTEPPWKMDNGRKHGGEKNGLKWRSQKRNKPPSRHVFKWLQILNLCSSNNTCEADF